jgi:uncharacterized membrane protein
VQTPASLPASHESVNQEWKMHFLDTITITFAGLMVGNERAVSAFVNPAVWQLENGPQAQELSILARSLGRAMPVWYGLCLALLALESFLHRHQAALIPLLAATLIWVGVIVFTIGVLVPINDRIACLNPAAPTPGWNHDHKKWDSLHRVRVLLLAVALFALTWALVA